MKNKVINLFGNSKIVQNKGVKYSTLLEQFVKPFESEFSDFKYYEDIFELAINAWNLGNMKLIIPKKEAEILINKMEAEAQDRELLRSMISYKISHFSEYSNFIMDYELSGKQNSPTLSVITQEEDVFFANMAENIKNENTPDDFEENYINRTAIIIKPAQAFIDWYLNIYPDDVEEFEEVKKTKIYFISEEIDDVEAWLKKKFKKIFELELDTWHFNKKEWPQKRNYKMFLEWFQFDISKMNYDLEDTPISKYC